MAPRKKSTAAAGGKRTPKQPETENPKPAPVGHDLLSFGPLLSLKQDDAALKEAVEALGGKLRIRPSDQLGYLTIKKAGVEFRFEKESWLTKADGPLRSTYVLTEVGVHAAGDEGYKQYAGWLLKGLTFASTRDAVRKALGKPVKSGGGNRFGTIVFKEWDRFRVRRTYFVEFSYLPESYRICQASINLVRLSVD